MTYFLTEPILTQIWRGSHILNNTENILILALLKLLIQIDTTLSQNNVDDHNEKKCRLHIENSRNVRVFGLFSYRLTTQVKKTSRFVKKTWLIILTHQRDVYIWCFVIEFRYSCTGKSLQVCWNPCNVWQEISYADSSTRWFWYDVTSLLVCV